MIKFANYLTAGNIKTIKKILTILILSLVTIQVICYVALQMPCIQTWITHKTIAVLSKQINGEISIGKVYIIFFNQVIFKEVSIVSNNKSEELAKLKKEYNHSDTLLKAKNISISISASELFKKRLKINKLYISDGEFNLQSETDSTTNLDRIFKLNETSQETSTKESNFKTSAGSFKLRNFRFRLNNPFRSLPEEEGIINFSDLDVRGINIDARRINFANGILNTEVKQITATDKSGYGIKQLNCHLRVGKGLVELKELHVQDNFSTINANYYRMAYKSAKDFSNFTREIILSADFKNTYFNFATVGKITSSMSDNRFGLYLNGKIKGTISDMESKLLSVTSESGKTFTEIAFRIKGLPNASNTVIKGVLNNCVTTPDDLSYIIAQFSGSPKKNALEPISPFTKISLNGEISGYFNNLNILANITSSAGNAKANINLNNSTKKRTFIISGKVKTNQLNLNSLLSLKNTGNLTAEGDLSMTFPKRNSGGMIVNIDNFKINQVTFNSYNYSNIYITGKYSPNEIIGSVICNDKNLILSVSGSYRKMSDGKTEYDLNSLSVPKANITALNLYKNDTISNFTIMMAGKFTIDKEHYLNGSAKIGDISFKNKNGERNIGDIAVIAEQEDGNCKITLNSDFADVTYFGTNPADVFINKFLSNCSYNHLERYLHEGKTPDIINEGEHYRVTLLTHDTRNIFELFSPGLYIHPETKLRVIMNNTDKIKMSLKSGRIAYGKNYMKSVDIRGESRDSTTKLEILSESTLVAGIKLDSTSFSVKGINNVFNTSFFFQNDSLGNNKANINTQLVLNKIIDGTNKNGKDNSKWSTVLKINYSDITLAGEKWQFQPSSFMIADSTIWINNLKLYNKSQSLSIDGLVSKRIKDSISVNLKNFNISVFNMLLDKPFNIKGHFSGDAKVSSLKKNHYVFINITGDSVSVYNNLVGTMRVLSRWNQQQKHFNLLVNSRLEGKSIMNITGFYRPEDTYVDVTASLSDFSIAYFEPLLSDIISKTNGTLSGRLRLFGTPDKLKLTGEDCNFNNFGFMVNFTGVPYVLNGPITVTENGIFFKNLDIADQFGSHGRVNGGVKYHYFKDVLLDTKVSFNEFQCLSTSDNEDQAFYGNAFASGSIEINGPISKINLGIKISTGDKTDIHIPISNSGSSRQADLLTFLKKPEKVIIDPFDTLLFNKSKVKKSSELAVDFTAKINPDATIFLEINKEVGDILKVNGSGNITMNIKPSKQIFNIMGDYVVTDGTYKFVLGGILNRDFTIKQGGKINFNGDIDNTTLDLTAIYKIKTAINTLISDTSSVSTRRNVNCELGLSGNMTNPKLKFNITIPDLDPTTKLKVESALNTEGKIQKQFAALLVYGGFVESDAGGIGGNGSLFTNVSEILSGQLNNILQQLGIPIDLGVNYQQNKKGENIFDFAVSTQLFNNRVVINGNIGNSPYSTSTNTNVIGNIDVEIKLDKNGRLRMNLFSHAPDQYTNYLDNSQRSGAGIVYQQEFNSFKDLFKKKSKEQKEYEKQQKAKKRAARKASKIKKETPQKR